MFEAVVDFLAGPAAQSAQARSSAPAGIAAQPMLVNAPEGSLHSTAAYRLDAIRRAITQKQEDGLDFGPAWLERMRQHAAETFHHAEVLRREGLLSPEGADEAVGFVIAALERAKHTARGV